MSVRVTIEHGALLGTGGTSNTRVTAQEVALLGTGGTSNARVTDQMVAILCSVTAAQDPIFRIPGFIGL